MINLLPRESKLVQVSDLIKMAFVIPPFQRSYAWDREQQSLLLHDLESTMADNKPLFLGMCVLAQNDGSYEIIDGQQRIATLAILLKVMGELNVIKTSSSGESKIFVTLQEPDNSWMRRLMFGEAMPNPARYSQKLLSECFGYFNDNKHRVTLDHVLSSQIIMYCAPDLQGATSLFERVNLRGKEISTIELVKNRLFDWAARVSDFNMRISLEDEVKSRFASVFVQLNPTAEEDKVDPDSFLKTHWILFDRDVTKTSDLSDVLSEIENLLKGAVSEISGNERDLAIARSIRRYISSLDQTCIFWRKITSPESFVFGNQDTKDALISFKRLRREANFTPMLVASLQLWGEGEQTAEFVRFIEIVCFRQALNGDVANTGRAAKWRIAKKVAQSKQELSISIKQVFWNVCPWWDQAEGLRLSQTADIASLGSEFAERAFDDTKAYDKFGRLMRYFFWEYGKWLSNRVEWAETREDVCVLTDEQWGRAFQNLEIEHIFPQRPRNLEDKDVRVRLEQMASYMNHWGNLTLLTKRDNASLQNSIFREKLKSVLENNANLLFNKLLANPAYRGNLAFDAWCPNNCRKRVAQLKEFADVRWGASALEKYELGSAADA